ncbi:MAG TPA: hypothetical protein DEA55_11795 [Rhodospirillaceae bacterium]|nr:hypothetical protein [Rhodospirillaceae bacterium]
MSSKADYLKSAGFIGALVSSVVLGIQYLSYDDERLLTAKFNSHGSATVTGPHTVLVQSLGGAAQVYTYGDDIPAGEKEDALAAVCAHLQNLDSSRSLHRKDFADKLSFKELHCSASPQPPGNG